MRLHSVPMLQKIIIHQEVLDIDHHCTEGLLLVAPWIVYIVMYRRTADQAAWTGQPCDSATVTAQKASKDDHRDCRSGVARTRVRNPTCEKDVDGTFGG